MTYRRKLFLKKLLRIAGIVVAAVLVLLLIGFTYLSRYIIYTEDGAHFSFDEDRVSEENESLMQTTSAPESPVLVTGDGVERTVEETTDADAVMDSTDISGVLIDYATLSAGTDLTTIDFADYNTLMLEMRSNGSEILTSEPVMELISRAQDQGMHLIALISCLDDTDYALEHADDALQITGGALWATDSGSYYLNPASENVQEYIASMIQDLGEMGFSEIVLNNFSFPYSTSIDYDTDEANRDQALIDAYENICNLVGDSYALGILISNPDESYQLINTATHLYVYFSVGSDVDTYASEHEGAYIVFLTDSHDTRFNAYGRISTEITFSDQVTTEAGQEEETADTEGATDDENPDEAGADADETADPTENTFD